VHDFAVEQSDRAVISKQRVGTEEKKKMREGGQSHAQATMHPVLHDIDMSSMGNAKIG
jgi:hypothetical protein